MKRIFNGLTDSIMFLSFFVLIEFILIIWLVFDPELLPSWGYFACGFCICIHSLNLFDSIKLKFSSASNKEVTGDV